ncbi:hypothetical protein SAY87_018431 [Trapa incisa]|uniref:Uncharacterized protein n=1 Tax=Trapa incisa TaxID=236973 RepID=A0AAN7L609_9MYRT|nr:hypothetical protein SAY87_018431 [Trapa incisa]
MCRSSMFASVCFELLRIPDASNWRHSTELEVMFPILPFFYQILPMTGSPFTMMSRIGRSSICSMQVRLSTISSSFNFTIFNFENLKLFIWSEFLSNFLHLKLPSILGRPPKLDTYL